MPDLAQDLRDYVDAVAPPVGLPEVRARRRPPRRRRPWWLATAAVVVALAFLAALAAGGGQDDDVDPADTSATSTGAPDAVVIGGPSSVTVSGRDGAALWRLAEGSGDWGLAVAGSDAVYWGRTAADSGACPTPEIVRIELGPAVAVEPVARPAAHPAVSPDGRLLAYTRPEGCVLAHATVVVRDLVTGEEQAWTGADLGVEDVWRLAWAPDSQRLAFVARTTGDGSTYPVILHVADPDAALERVIHPDGTAWYGWLGDTGEMLGSRTPGDGEGRTHEVVAFDAGTWAITRTLFTVPGQVEAAVADPTGGHVLAVVGSVLYRWSEGDEAAVLVTGGVEEAGWLPSLDVFEAGR